MRRAWHVLILTLVWALLSTACAGSVNGNAGAGQGGAGAVTWGAELRYHVDLKNAAAETPEGQAQRPGTDATQGATKASGKGVLESIADVMRARLAALNVGSFEIRPLGDDVIVLSLPVVPNRRFRQILGVLERPATLAFRLVDDELDLFRGLDSELEQFKTEHPDEATDLAWVEVWGRLQLSAPRKRPLERFVRELRRLEKIPEGRTIGFVREEDGSSADRAFPRQVVWRTEVLYAAAGLTGDHLVKAEVVYDDIGLPAVSMEFDPQGAELFLKLTGEHIDDFLAIMLDDEVYSAPMIKEAIAGGKARITLASGGERSAMIAEATQMVTLLSTGAYKAPVYLQQEMYQRHGPMPESVQTRILVEFQPGEVLEPSAIAEALRAAMGPAQNGEPPASVHVFPYPLGQGDCLTYEVLVDRTPGLAEDQCTRVGEVLRQTFHPASLEALAGDGWYMNLTQPAPVETVKKMAAEALAEQGLPGASVESERERVLLVELMRERQSGGFGPGESERDDEGAEDKRAGQLRVLLSDAVYFISVEPLRSAIESALRQHPELGPRFLGVSAVYPLHRAGM